METGAIPLDAVDGPFDLQSTIESGQTYLWWREDGTTYEADDPYGGDAWYATVAEGQPVRVRQADGRLEWESTDDARDLLVDLLRLDDDLDRIVAATPEDELLDAAYDAYRGMRVPHDPFFGCLISFICSPQMRVERIFGMQRSLREAYGEPVDFRGETYRAYPTPGRLAAATEAELRDLGLGYRAPYVTRTAEMVASGELTAADVRDLPYEEARERLTEFVGVGEKVADCVALFALGHLEAVPLDTWIRTAIDEHYPECAAGNYRETSRAIRERFGPYAGYVQTYVFHYLRNRG